MKKILLHLSLVVFTILYSCSQTKQGDVDYRDFQESEEKYAFSYKAGNWDYPDYTAGYTSFGNHRFRVKVKDPANRLVRAKFNPRRIDFDASGKAIIVTDGITGERVESSFVVSSGNEIIDIVFSPNTDSEEYFIYYLPHICSGGYYPTVEYIKLSQPDVKTWFYNHDISVDKIDNLPLVDIIAAESLDEFHSFFPMEVPASNNELEGFIKANPSQYYLFPEYRHFPIKMSDNIPLRWLAEMANGLKETVKRGEYFTFQIGAFSPENSLKNLSIEYSDLKGSKGKISKDNFTCFNTEGIDLNGEYFEKDLVIEAGKVQSLWFGLNLNEDIKAGSYNGIVIIKPEGLPADSVYINIDISNEIAIDNGDNTPEKMTRMRWLNSTAGVDSDHIIDPFVPVTVNDKRVSVLGRDIVLNDIGLPAKIESFFSQEMTFLNDEGQDIISSPITFDVYKTNGQILNWETSDFSIDKLSKGAVEWSASNTASSFVMTVHGKIEYDGMLDYQIELVSNEDIDIGDIKLIVPFRSEVAEYMLGLGKKGGRLQEAIDWKWNVKFHNEGVWLGTINRGIQYVLRDNNYERPLNTNFYQDKPLNMPPSWFNQEKGGIRIIPGEESTIAENYSGPRKILQGDTLNFNIRFLITPFKPIDTESHFNTRFVHKYIPVDSVKSLHGTIVNVHHANAINPYINYPFFNVEEQKEYIDEAHSKGIKVKLYNTIRELTYKAYELFPLRSLGDEILNTGKGGGHSWLQEHLRSDYYSAWHATRVNDAAILNKGSSRWTNYYIEGINWLARNQGMDGLYLDDIAFSRSTVKRIANVLSKHRGNYVIDLHSANQYNSKDGFINSAFLYMEHFPYVSRLWFGEYFDYFADPDYWFTEVSGLPFGLTGEMLQDGGRPYHGLLYGMTTRVYGNYNPSEIWRIFDEFGIAQSRMLGYWVDKSPIKTEKEGIQSTVYLLEDKAMIVLASWSDKDTDVDINIDWASLGYDRTSVRLHSPEMKGMQEYAEFDLDNRVKVPAQSGLILILE